MSCSFMLALGLFLLVTRVTAGPYGAYIGCFDINSMGLRPENLQVRSLLVRAALPLAGKAISKQLQCILGLQEDECRSLLSSKQSAPHAFFNLITCNSCHGPDRCCVSLLFRVCRFEQQHQASRQFSTVPAHVLLVDSA